MTGEESWLKFPAWRRNRPWQDLGGRLSARSPSVCWMAWMDEAREGDGDGGHETFPGALLAAVTCWFQNRLIVSGYRDLKTFDFFLFLISGFCRTDLLNLSFIYPREFISCVSLSVGAWMNKLLCLHVCTSAFTSIWFVDELKTGIILKLLTLSTKNLLKIGNLVKFQFFPEKWFKPSFMSPSEKNFFCRGTSLYVRACAQFSPPSQYWPD